VRRLLVAGVIVVGVAAVALPEFYERWRPPDVRGSPTVEFVPGDVPESRPIRGTAAKRAAISWPTYGFDARRLRHAPGVKLRPPFRRLWTFRGGALLEFPPAVAHGRIYLPTFDGRFYALDSRTGEPRWRFVSGRCSWGSPAVAGRLVYATFLNRRDDCDARTNRLGGEVVAFDADSGRVRWKRVIGPTESSPLVAGAVVYVGDWLGNIHAFDRYSGRSRWRFRTDGPVKGSVALAGGRAFIGSYDGHVYALDARTGRLLWRAAGQRRLPGPGHFYSTPSVAYGRVYIGSTDGKMYSYGAQSGALRWATRTGGYVYSSPAVWKRLVLVGSYDGFFYAFDAATGEERWRFRANGPISGSPTVLAGLVYFSTLQERTYVLDARTGTLVWNFADGKYSPAVSDGQRLYLVGQGRLYGMVPSRAARGGSDGSRRSRSTVRPRARETTHRS
jgi:outer membrane protein assembly factor BamB